MDSLDSRRFTMLRMRRRFQFIAVDEAHKIKAKDSEQAKAVRMLKARYKLLSTGTLIANYPRNIFSLLVFGWGDGTELNPYGYHNPIEQTSERGYTSGYTTGTRQFKEDFISIEWVTPQFEQTLYKGMKSREMPKIKDTAKWWEMMLPKIIRRQREEPEVAAFVTIPKPEISTEIIKMSPEQVKHYKHWLDEFAAWFKEQLRLEKQSEGHKIDQMVVLAHLTQLQFASTIPQSKKTNNEHIQWPGGITTKQRRTLDLIEEALSKQEKIIVFSERPDFQKLMQQELKIRELSLMYSSVLKESRTETWFSMISRIMEHTFYSLLRLAVRPDSTFRRLMWSSSLIRHGRQASRSRHTAGS